MELRGRPHDVAVFDDFAHHPTAVATTLEGVRERHPDQRIFALFEPRSATVPEGFQQPYTEAFDAADRVWIAANARAAELPESERFYPKTSSPGCGCAALRPSLARRRDDRS